MPEASCPRMSGAVRHAPSEQEARHPAGLPSGVPRDASLVIDPPGPEWPALLARRREHRLTASLRDQLGLPVGVPIVMTGHQPTLWHAGILAKYLAAHAASRRLGASPAWLVVDQDEVGAIEVRCPVLDAGRVRVARAVLGAPDDAEPPACHRPPIADLGPLGALRAKQPDLGLAAGLDRLAAALRGARGASSLAEQISDALEALMEPLIPRAPTILATVLAQTNAFAELADRMFADPERCVGAYNAACAAFPDAGTRPLAIASGRIELPLWRLEPGAPRRRVFAGAPRPPVESLAPRALLMTGLLRLAACDLFIHGTGGARYDRVTDRWFSRWLGEDTLAPTTMVTATLLLAVEGAAPDDPAAVDAARWRAHAAAHNPALVSDSAAGDKARLLAEIDAAPRRSPDRARTYQRLHALLTAYRDRRADSLADLDRRAHDLADHARATRALLDRTYPFPLHPPGTLAALRDAVAAEFATLAT